MEPLVPNRVHSMVVVTLQHGKGGVEGEDYGISLSILLINFFSCKITKIIINCIIKLLLLLPSFGFWPSSLFKLSYFVVVKQDDVS